MEFSDELFKRVTSNNHYDPAPFYSGIDSIDSTVYGFPKGNMTIVAGYPNSGKLDFCLQSCLYMAMQQNKKVVIINLHDSDIRERLLKSSLAELESNKRGKALTKSDHAKLHKKLEDATIEIEDYSTESLTPSILSKILSKLYKKYNPDVILLNNIQNVVHSFPKNSNLYTEVTLASRHIHRCARQYNIPIIVISELNRITRSYNDQSPTIYSLRDSGTLEEDAALILLLHPIKIRNKYLIQANVAKSRYSPQNIKIKLGYNETNHRLYDL